MRDGFRWAMCAQSRNRPLARNSDRAGGTREISRWCNHRTTPAKHEPRPGRAREGHARCCGQHRRGTIARFSRPCRGAGRLGRPGSGGSRSLRDLHHRLISFEPPARQQNQRLFLESAQIKSKARRMWLNLVEINFGRPFLQNEHDLLSTFN